MRKLVAALKETRGSQKESEDTLHFPDMCVGVWRLDGTLMNANKEFMRAFQMTKEIIENRPHFKTILHPEKFEEAYGSFHKVLAGLLENYSHEN